MRRSGQRARRGRSAVARNWDASATYGTGSVRLYAGRPFRFVGDAPASGVAPLGAGDGSAADRQLLLDQRVGVGYGRNAGTAGVDMRTAPIYTITSTADSGAGTLRDALTTAGPLWILPDKSAFPADEPANVQLLSRVMPASDKVLDCRGAGVRLLAPLIDSEGFLFGTGASYSAPPTAQPDGPHNIIFSNVHLADGPPSAQGSLNGDWVRIADNAHDLWFHHVTIETHARILLAETAVAGRKSLMVDVVHPVRRQGNTNLGVAVLAGTDPGTFRLSIQERTQVGPVIWAELESFDNLASPAAAVTALLASAYVRGVDLGSASSAPGNNPKVTVVQAISGGDDLVNPHKGAFGISFSWCRFKGGSRGVSIGDNATAAWDAFDRVSFSHCDFGHNGARSPRVGQDGVQAHLWNCYFHHWGGIHPGSGSGAEADRQSHLRSEGNVYEYDGTALSTAGLTTDNLGPTGSIVASIGDLLLNGATAVTNRSGEIFDSSASWVDQFGVIQPGYAHVVEPATTALRDRVRDFAGAGNPWRAM